MDRLLPPGLKCCVDPLSPQLKVGMSALKTLFHCVVVDQYSTYLEIISPNLDESLALEEGKSTFASLDIQ